MAEAKTAVANKPAWVDLSTSDAAGAREFYSKLFGWKIEVNPDPQYGGYGMGEVCGKQGGGVAPPKLPEAPPAWWIYFFDHQSDDPAQKSQAAGGKGISPPFPLGEEVGLAG